MNKKVSLALLAGGSRLTMFGVGAYASARYDIPRRVPGSPAFHAKWMLIGGVLVTVVGLMGLLRSPREG